MSANDVRNSSFDSRGLEEFWCQVLTRQLCFPIMIPKMFTVLSGGVLERKFRCYAIDLFSGGPTFFSWFFNLYCCPGRQYSRQQTVGQNLRFSPISFQQLPSALTRPRLNFSDPLLIASTYDIHRQLVRSLAHRICEECRLLWPHALFRWNSE